MKTINYRFSIDQLYSIVLIITFLTLSGCSSTGIINQNGCLSAEHPTNVSQRSIPGKIWEVDFQRSITGELEKELQLRLKETTDKILEKVPGVSIAIAVPGEGIWSDHRGISNINTGDPVAGNDLFQIASITKSFTAIIIMQLVQEKRLQLNDRVATWFPNVPNADVMSIEHLLRHTNGLVSFNVLPELGTQYRSPDEVIELASAQPPQFCPGAQWAYSNTGYAILGRIIEIIEGEPLHDVFDRRIKIPLAIDHTFLRRPDDRISTVVGHNSKKPVQVDDGYATAYAAGAIASTALDIVRFWHAFMAGKIVSVDQLHDMYSRLSPMDQSGQMFYGIGVQMYDVVQGPGLMLGHSGGITGFTSIVAYVLEDDLFISVLFNDKDIPAEVGLWSLVRTIREYRNKYN